MARFGELTSLPRGPIILQRLPYTTLTLRLGRIPHHEGQRRRSADGRKEHEGLYAARAWQVRAAESGPADRQPCGMGQCVPALRSPEPSVASVVNLVSLRRDMRHRPLARSRTRAAGPRSIPRATRLRKGQTKALTSSMRPCPWGCRSPWRSRGQVEPTECLEVGPKDGFRASWCKSHPRIRCV